MDKEFKRHIEEWIKILNIVRKATSSIGNNLVDTLYLEFHLNETFEDVELLIELNPKGYDEEFVEWEFRTRERLKIGR
tara:strand:+ start:35 stop:268 length:234 start_codon:yes stop_codon:yes gene_type:complete